MDRVFHLTYVWSDYEDWDQGVMGVYTDIADAYADIVQLTVWLRKIGYTGRSWPDISVTTEKLGFNPIWTYDEIVADMELHFPFNEYLHKYLDEDGKLTGLVPQFFKKDGKEYLNGFRDEAGNQLFWRNYHQGIW